ncbi:hypothetical protein Srubr_39740 [Streptomyces rubradiris]|uniref:Uncharacterized protein n=1 Tax=Streptomyces rubradiris TaxID=285531 RepID=A0ABQ3RE49_STRRR|nr:hypothetical protein GCM10018792_72460 [Streptomyces rubradiris]GHI54128.1 hypothetical protein Srubr_39740 [Streptomyces rubradiris]
MIPPLRQPRDLRVPGLSGVRGSPVGEADQRFFTAVLTYGYVTYGFVAYDHVGSRHRSPGRSPSPRPMSGVPLEFL